MTLYIILTFAALCAGMAVSVYAFGTGGKRKRIFQDIYFTVEDVDGIGVLYTKTGEYSAVLRMENPVQKYSADIDSYYEFTSLLTAIATQAGRFCPQAVRGRDKRASRVPVRCLFPLLQWTEIHGQHLLPDRHAGSPEKRPVLFRRQEVARLPREDT